MKCILNKNEKLCMCIFIKQELNKCLIRPNHNKKQAFCGNEPTKNRKKIQNILLENNTRAKEINIHAGASKQPFKINESLKYGELTNTPKSASTIKRRFGIHLL